MPDLTNIWIMAFDFGEARIGVAIGNTLLKIAHPVTTITGRNKFEKLDKIAKLIDEWKPKYLVVGIPAKREDNALLISAITRFANRLQHRFKLALSFINEDYTSSIASRKLTEQSIHGIAQKGKLDQLAACGILQAYFDQYSSGGPSPT